MAIPVRQEADREIFRTREVSPPTELEEGLDAFAIEGSLEPPARKPRISPDALVHDIRARMSQRSAPARTDNTAPAATPIVAQPNHKLLVGMASVAGVLLTLGAVTTFLGDAQSVTPPSQSAAAPSDEAVTRTGRASSDSARRTALPAAGAVTTRPTQVSPQSTAIDARLPIIPAGALSPSGAVGEGAIRVDPGKSGAASRVESTPVGASQLTSGNERVSGLPDDTVYSADDREVLPPKALSFVLPRPTLVGAPTQTNTIELLVSARGTVEHVRLVTPPRRMPDMMILSHAKVWEFAPASKDGRPVRYRLVLSWEVNP